MTNKFTPPTTCRVCGGAMEAGALRTTRESYRIPDGYPFDQLTSGELWYSVMPGKDGKPTISMPPGGPLMVLHYRCTDCGYLESYAQGTYPQ